MMNKRKIATLGIGFGALAISSIGLLPDAEIINPPINPPIFYGGGGGGPYKSKIKHTHYKVNKISPKQTQILFNKTIEIEDEETVIITVLLELAKQDILC
jgi:hypothetical protein